MPPKLDTPLVILIILASVAVTSPLYEMIFGKNIFEIFTLLSDAHYYLLQYGNSRIIFLDLSLGGLDVKSEYVFPVLTIEFVGNVNCAIINTSFA